MHEKTAFRSAPPPPRTHPGQRLALGAVGVVRVPGSFVADSPLWRTTETKDLSRARTLLASPKEARPPTVRSGKQRFPRSRSRAASNPGSLPLSFESPPARAGGMIVRSTGPASPHQGERPTRERPASRSTRLLPASGEGKSGKTAQVAPPDAYPRRGGWRTTRFTSGQLLLSANRKIPEDLLVELQEFVAMTLSHASSMMKILLVHFNMKYNGKSIILCITRVDFHIPLTSYPHNDSQLESILSETNALH